MHPQRSIILMGAIVNVMFDQLTAERHARHEAVLTLEAIHAAWLETGDHPQLCEALWTVARTLRDGRIVVREAA